MTAQFEGLPGLRADLVAAGFKLAYNCFSTSGNWCNWYAYRRSTLAAPECESNEGKGVQIVVNPYEFEIGEHQCRGVEVEITGEAGGRWHKVNAYSIKADELIQSMPEIEASLIAAWSAFKRDTTAKEHQ